MFHIYTVIYPSNPKSNLLPSFHNQSSRKWVSQILVFLSFRGPIFHFQLPMGGSHGTSPKTPRPPVSMTKSTTPQLQTSPFDRFFIDFFIVGFGVMCFFLGSKMAPVFHYQLWFPGKPLVLEKKNLPTFLLVSLPKKSW